MLLSDTWIDFLAGWCSGGVAVVAIQPVDTILTRLQAGNRAVPAVTIAAAAASVPGRFSAATNARSLVSGVSIGSLWRGSSAMVGAVPVQNALLMGGYGFGKRWSSDQEDSSQEALIAIFMGGFVGGILQSFVMSPVELIKVNQQIRTDQSALAAGKEVVQSVVNNGTIGLWRGLGATLLRDGIPHGVWFVSYEICKNYLEALYGGGGSGGSSATTVDNFVESKGTNWTIPLVSGAVAATVAWVSCFLFALLSN